MDQYVPNTAMWALYEEGKIDFTVTQKDIPHILSLKLNTASFRQAVPQLYAKYPNASIQLHITAAGPRPPT